MCVGPRSEEEQSGDARSDWGSHHHRRFGEHLDKLGFVVSLDRSLNLPVTVATGALIVIEVVATIAVTVLPG